MKEGWTPGPWIVTDDPYIHVRSPEHGCVLARDYTTEANARLISASPDLYEALKRIADHDGVSYRFGDEVRAIANEALAKARGE